MGLTGKYDFPGIKKWGANGLSLTLGTTGWGAAILASPFRVVVEVFTDHLINWMANNGLIVFNIGAIYVEGKIDQKKFDQAMEEGLARLKIPGISEAEKKAIDEKVIEAIRKFGRITDHN